MAIEQVRSLVADRHRYESWLEALDARRNETPDRVYSRVRDDYSARRSEVLAQLQALLPDMTALRESREQHLRSLEEQLANLEDERAEAMLRTAVGEFDSERWEAVRVDVEGKLVAIGEERDALLIEVDEIRTLIEQSRGDEATEPSESEHEASADAAPADVASVEMASTDVADAAVSVAEEPAESVGDDVAGGGAPEGTEGPMILDHVDELDDLTLPGTPEHQGTAVATAPVESSVDLVDEAIGAIPRDAWLESATDMSDEVGTPVAPPAAADPVNIVSAIESVLLDSEAPVLPPVQAAPAASDEWDEALAVFDGKPAVGAAPVAPAAPAPGAASADPFDDLAFLRSIMDPAETPATSLKTPMAGSAAVPDLQAGAETADPQKSLRCSECGTMNAPTEWYCERCGGELITI